jgi:dipeptide/tripeptide permease
LSFIMSHWTSTMYIERKWLNCFVFVLGIFYWTSNSNMSLSFTMYTTNHCLCECVCGNIIRINLCLHGCLCEAELSFTSSPLSVSEL